MNIVIAFPCLNEELTIFEVLNKIPKQLEGVNHIELLVIDDGSTDKTAEKARAGGAVVISHGINKGLGAAFQSAITYCIDQGADILVTMDGDGQFSPDDLPEIIKPILLGKADMVTGSRFIKSENIPSNIPSIKLWGNKRMANLISTLVGRKIHDAACGYRAYSSKAFLNLNLLGKYTYTQETLLDLSYKNLNIQEVPISVKYFDGRKSRIAGSIIKYAFNTSKIIFRVYRDYFPLRFFWFFSLIFLILGLPLALFFLLHYLETGGFSGQLWSGFLSSFLMILSLTFFVVGLVVDLLDRIRVNQDRTLFWLKEQKHRMAKK